VYTFVDRKSLNTADKLNVLLKQLSFSKQRSVCIVLFFLIAVTLLLVPLRRLEKQLVDWNENFKKLFSSKILNSEDSKKSRIKTKVKVRKALIVSKQCLELSSQYHQKHFVKGFITINIILQKDMIQCAAYIQVKWYHDTQHKDN